MMTRHAPAAERNREPIANELESLLPSFGEVLEIASGTGQHAVYFAERFADLVWHPSDPDPEARLSIESWRQQSGFTNLRAPLALDVIQEDWPRLALASGCNTPDAVFCANMIHIARWEACLGLLRGTSELLAEGGQLILYGPFRFGGTFTAPSNEAFDRSLRSRDPRWGVRDLDDLQKAASRFALRHDRTIDMPANNHLVVLRRHA